ncbi:adenylyl-sulfate kinase (plasmid) [Azospirillum brasilense]|uniref:Bifunctional enzyme NodQ n=2 Tax=Azospirillum brasilense TaxID=192 RepID=NODQ_AZOBR|nr:MULTISPECIES: adenylyl-sulfate kinase [Azospirillum]P28604.2 RecName: Full=Bifunctional enzyme NodQ; AltName: Full=Nodulation protein Q; Includes: RecName: Full=Sulfate adenylyltransferase subunit 1; AltName: Full=ATP-sulfurylase large subunit; AltName: Full=Sulfate adenylate transferase; Short=SAT; Includes: RecName: Full=Adenylyl-sulfate kinase; AltName: Full=APS kinase; AltName: Full=ATP adenosine-5'-phosphosulfate 3'-phosphotransferase [Azospirillum brasilense]AAS83003.1 sulfate adenylate 
METGTGRGLLRFLTCGSVDDGKSTLIGRLLHDAGLISDDQLEQARRDSRGRAEEDGGIDFSLLVDGLEAEREQSITIDVAYRYFATDRRSFIVADAPGHEQYTRNMATAASGASLAVLLVDARKGLLTQTRRHAIVASLMGIRHVVLAVNKMDLVEDGETVFAAIRQAFTVFSAPLGFRSVTAIPLSARHGDNVVHRSAAMPWHHGPTLLGHLETAAAEDDPTEDGPLRFLVEWVNRPNLDFRGLSGTLLSGSLETGGAVTVWPSGRSARIARIVTFDGDVTQARAGDAVTVTLDAAVDAGRGDLLSGPDGAPEVADQFAAHLLWMAEEPLIPGRSYLLRAGARWVPATVTALRHAVNVETLEHGAASVLGLNAVGLCNLSTAAPLAFDPYEASRHTGSFILVDRFSNRTVGAGMIRHPLRRAANLHRQELAVSTVERAALKRQRPAVLWFTGLSGSGKSTIANRVERRLHTLGHHTMMLDGDNVRLGLNRDLGFTDADRVENIRRVGEVAKLMTEAGLIVLCAFIAPFRAEREAVRALLPDGAFLEVFVDTPLDECMRRDPKGLYAKARAGTLRNFTGVDSPYEAPDAPELRLDTTAEDADALAERVVELLHRKGIAEA